MQNTKVLLNKEQLKAATTINGPLLILAGAGAGKTKTITERVVEIVKSGVSPNQILCVTFTNKAANEMKERILHRLKEEGLIENSVLENFYGASLLPTIKTFHSLGLSILKDFGSHFGLTKNLTILDTSDSLSIIKSVLVEMNLDPKLHEPNKIKNAISREKGSFNTVEKYLQKVSSFNMEVIAKVWAAYEKELTKQKSVDFDDLLIKTVILLKENQKVRDHYRNKFKYIHVDEYQDTNEAQYEMILGLLNEEHKNLCVVGDADQNIYSWRGANLKNILNFENDFPNSNTVILEENYRSTGNILALANIGIKKNKARKDKKLFTSKGLGEEIEVCPAWDESGEADLIAKKCKEIIKAAGNKNASSQIAILFRANFQSRIIEDAMIENDVPYKMLGVRFFDRKEIKDVLSYFRAALNRESLSDMKRVFETPKKGLGKVTLAKVFAGETASLTASNRQKVEAVHNFLDKIKSELENKKLSEVMLFTIIESGIEKEMLEGSDDDKERLENVRELVSIAQKYDEVLGIQSIERFLEEASLRSDQDEDTGEDNGVRIMTIHAAKGLEFDYVFVTGLEHDLFPHKNIGGKKMTLEEQEEERRLFYVAVTRAKKKLFLTYAEIRTIYGQKQINIPSEFLEDINEMEESSVIYNSMHKKDYSEGRIIRYDEDKYNFSTDF